ncbi:MAG: cation:proton antiporter [Myxococcota bacterium]
MNFGPLGTLALVLTAGLVGGEVASRLRMPRVTGWILTGVGLAALGLPGLEPERVSGFKHFSDFVLGYIAFTVGSHFHVRSLINARTRLFFLALTEALITPAVVLLVMCGLGGLSLDYGLLLAAVALAGAPGTTVLVIGEAQARGVFVKTLMGAIVLIDVVAVVYFGFVESVLQEGGGLTLAAVAQAAPHVLFTLAEAAVVGVACALITVLLTRAIVGAQLLGASIVASILLAWGAAEQLGVSSILAVTFLGIALANIIADKERAGEAYLNTFGSVLFTAFYTLAGMRLDFRQALPMASLVALYFLGRLVGKWLSATTAMSLAGAPKRVRFLLGPALLPHGGVAVGLILIIQGNPALSEYADLVLAVGLSALAINQFIGPSVTRWSLVRSGEANLDRPRLLDFLREQDILVNLQAKDRSEAIGQLVDHLYKTHDVKADKREFLNQVVQRDAQESTCLGDGLMIPHARIKQGQQVVGVMGLSSKGFDWDAPDGRPIHAIVLLATPESQKNRHLEVIAAFANVIVSHREIGEQLYHAGTAAHAYDVLHAEEATDFNYFLEDVLEESSSKDARDSTSETEARNSGDEREKSRDDAETVVT